MRWYLLLLAIVPTLVGRRGKLHVLLAIGLGFISAVLLSAIASLIGQSLSPGDMPPWLGLGIAGGGWLVSTLALLQPGSMRGGVARACSLGIVEWLAFIVSLETAAIVQLGSRHAFTPRALALSLGFCAIAGAGPVVLLLSLRRRFKPDTPTLSPPRQPV